MGVSRGNVEGLATPPEYTHWASVPPGTRLVFLAGQVPLDAGGAVVDGDHIDQTRQCLENLRRSLEAVGATASDAVRTTVYVVASEQRLMGEVWDAILESDVGDVARTAATLVGVARLGYTGQLVEIEVTVAVPS